METFFSAEKRHQENKATTVAFTLIPLAAVRFCDHFLFFFLSLTIYFPLFISCAMLKKKCVWECDEMDV